MSAKLLMDTRLLKDLVVAAADAKTDRERIGAMARAGDRLFDLALKDKSVEAFAREFHELMQHSWGEGEPDSLKTRLAMRFQDFINGRNWP
jgi:hypothetical protein